MRPSRLVAGSLARPGPTDLSETRTIVIKGGRRASRLSLLSARLRGLVADETRLAVAAAGGGLALISVGIVGARVLGESFQGGVFVAAMLLAVVGVVYPFVGVLAAILVSPTFAWATVGPDISPFQVVVLGAALGCLRRFRSLALVRRLLTCPEVALAGLFVGFLVITAAIRWDTTDWAFVRNYVGALAFFCICVVTLNTHRRRRYAIGALVIGSAATAVVGLAQLVTTEALIAGWVLPSVEAIQQGYDRLGSPWGLANVGSDYGKDVLAGFLIIVPFLFGRRAGWWRLVLGSVVIVLAVSLAMSGSRSAWLGAAVGLVYLAFTSRRVAVSVPLLAAAAALGFLIARPATAVDIQVGVGLPSQRNLTLAEKAKNREQAEAEIASSRQRVPGRGGRPAEARWTSPRQVIGGTKDPVSTDVSNDLRRRLTKAGLEMVRDEPLFGVGAGAFRDHVDRYEPISATGRPADARAQLSAHNVFLEIWAGSGTPVFFLYVCFIGAVLLRLHRTRTAEDGQRLCMGLIAALLGLVVTAAFHNYQYDNVLWALTGIAVSIGLWGKQDPNRRSPFSATRQTS